MSSDRPQTRGRTPRGSAPRPRPTHADDPTPQPLRIGDVARLVGTTPRTIRYYEEIGLLSEAPARPSGGHRTYTEAEVERLREVMRLKHLLGVTLEELKTLLSAEEARAAVRAELRREDVHPERRRELLEEALGHIDRQLALVEHRSSELEKLRDELGERRRRVRRRLRELDHSSPPRGTTGEGQEMGEEAQPAATAAS
jgi:DNA-binding transcriptional MerR regulator